MAKSAIAPGPKGWPLLGSIRQFRRDPLAFLRSAAEKFGPVVHYRMANQNAWLLNDPEMIRDVLVTRANQFTIGPVLEKSRALLGQGLLTSTGAFHLRQRRLMQPAFHRERLMGYGRVMTECAERACGQWQNGQALDMAEEMMRLTLAIVGRTLFGTNVDEEAEGMGRAMHAVMKLYPILFLPFSAHILNLPLPATRRFQEAKRLLNDTVFQLIAKRRASGEDAGDLLSMLLMAQEEDGSGMSDQQVHDEALTLFLAGHETTANALTWTWYLLGKHPEIRKVMEQELDEVLHGRLPEPEDMPRLRFADQVLTESLRLYPPAWVIGRRPLEPYHVDGYVISTDDVVLLSAYVMHRNPAYYEEPDSFRPERWTPEFRENLPKFAYLPFGGGMRQCIGERFAWMEGILLLATIAQRWRFELDESHKVDTFPVITLRTKAGVRVRARVRSRAQEAGSKKTDSLLPAS